MSQREPRTLTSMCSLHMNNFRGKDLPYPGGKPKRPGPRTKNNLFADPVAAQNIWNIFRDGESYSGLSQKNGQKHSHLRSTSPQFTLPSYEKNSARYPTAVCRNHCAFMRLVPGQGGNIFHRLQRWRSGCEPNRSRRWQFERRGDSR